MHEDKPSPRGTSVTITKWKMEKVQTRELLDEMDRGVPDQNKDRSETRAGCGFSHH